MSKETCFFLEDYSVPVEEAVYIGTRRLERNVPEELMLLR